MVANRYLQQFEGWEHEPRVTQLLALVLREDRMKPGTLLVHEHDDDRRVLLALSNGIVLIVSLPCFSCWKIGELRAFERLSLSMYRRIEPR